MTSGLLKHVVGGDWRSVVVGAASAALVGCQSPRSSATIKTIDDYIEVLEQWREDAARRCDGDPECVARVRDAYLASCKHAFEVRLDLIAGEWRDARKPKEDPAGSPRY